VAYQSLYRRYRPQTFSEMRGQEHVVKALRNAVRDDRVGHAYLLSGPRGTGKTTAARVLAKVLNCENPVDGEPDGSCNSCLSIEAGTSFDLHELDAASNNKVDDIRDLLSKVALGTPGRIKVYLLDEVHMLTSGAENALLKTLEEPPDHVVFVLATTEPHKVVATIRSRTQQLELTLIPADQMAEMVREIAADAGLEVSEEAVGHVVKVGGGSARDTLSALDQVVAAGGITDVDTSTSELLEAVASQDPSLALRAIEAATSRGADPRRIGESFVDALRSVFLVKMGAAPARLSEPEHALSNLFAERLSPGVITRSLEAVGRSLVDMRQAPDPRIDLEVAFVRICSVSSDASARGLAIRVEMLEAALESGVAPPAPAEPAPQQQASVPVAAPAETPTSTDASASVPVPTDTPAPIAAKEAPETPTPTEARPADAARAALRQRPEQSARQTAPPKTQPAQSTARPGGAPPPPSARGTSPAPAETPAVTPAPAPTTPETETAAPAEPEALSPAPDVQPTTPEANPTAAYASDISVERLNAGWSEMLDGQSTPARARFLAGRVASVEGDSIVFVLPTDSQVKRCEPFKAEVEKAVAEAFGTSLKIILKADNNRTPSTMPGAAPSAPAAAIELPQAEADIDIHDLTDADEGNATVVDRIADVFPGAEILEQES
jgi:DNA polymerase-3 subunit gamma/tau